MYNDGTGGQIFPGSCVIGVCITLQGFRRVSLNKKWDEVGIISHFSLFLKHELGALVMLIEYDFRSVSD